MAHLEQRGSKEDSYFTESLLSPDSNTPSLYERKLVVSGQ